jgi:hypothetical protein
MCRLVGVGVTQVNGTKWSNIRTQLESPHKRRNQDADECQRAGVRHPVRSQILRFRILDGKMRYIRMPGCVFVKDRILAPFMIQELFPSLIETASGSHPCRVVSVTYRKLRPFHGGNTGSNPVGDANLINNLRNCRFWRTTGYATVELLNHSTMCVAFFFRHGFIVDIHRD